MSLTASLNSAISGMNVAQRSIAVVSDNVANVNTEGYARRQVVQSPATIAGQIAGVGVEEIRRTADEFLNREFRIATAEFSRFDAAGGLHEQISSLLGDPTGDRNIVALLDKVLVAAGSLAANPETTAVRSSAIEALQRLTEDVDRLSDGVRDLRRQADQRVSQGVDDANLLLQEIHDLNQRIAGLRDDNNRVGLIDERSRKLDALSQIIDIRTADQSDDRVLVSTTGGLPLVDQSLRQLVHGGSNAGGFGEVFQPIGIQRIDDATGARVTISTNIDDKILSGELKGLMETRDGALNDLATELGAFGGRMADEINRVHNEFTAVPPAATLTGRNTGTLAADPHGFTGIATFHAFDANNTVTATATIDFGAIGGTVNDVITAVNAGLGGAATLALNNGVMSFTAAGGSAGVGIAQDAATPSDANGRGFAHRFGLNDLIQTTAGPHFETGLAATSNHGFTGTATFELIGPANQRPISATVDFGAIGGTVNNILTELNTAFTGVASFSLNGEGALVTTPSANFAGFRLETTQDATARGGTGVSVSDFFGIGSEPKANMAAGMSVNSEIVRTPSRLSLATIDPTGTPSAHSGDNAGAVALQALNFVTSEFDGAGRLPSMTGTLAEIGSEVLGRAGQAANDIQVRTRDREALMEDLSARVAEVSGVNIDEEMAQLIQLQAAFNAATRVISTTNEMIDALLAL
ncbi:MAG: flagellar hook-associated protein FlgK [Minwuia sp.]|uniref:flagellar hook-associated protein FlgK n=1 Tax=Minwuia sp. TaxID=2493630 RepID=UPI003A8C04A9